MTQDTAYIMVSIDGEEQFVSPQCARILAFLAHHHLIGQVLGIKELQFYQITIDGKGKNLQAEIKVR